MIERVKNYCCNKVLPVVYDDSLSYYEMICRLTNKINEIVDAINVSFEDLIAKQIERFFNSLMIDTIYDEETETITFKKEIVADGDHIYNVQNKSIEVK